MNAKINDGLNLTTTELEMFKEVTEVFEKYGSKTRKFGLQLVHSHFPLKNGEILHETNDKEKRFISIKPVSKNKLNPNALPTAWTIAKGRKPKVMMFCCDW